jgi:hypothetical protein
MFSGVEASLTVSRNRLSIPCCATWTVPQLPVELSAASLPLFYRCFHADLCQRWINEVIAVDLNAVRLSASIFPIRGSLRIQASVARCGSIPHPDSEQWCCSYGGDCLCCQSDSPRLCLIFGAMLIHGFPELANYGVYFLASPPSVTLAISSGRQILFA